ncbi:unnamed protein product, partial [Mesorhabditis belari]|uniref:Uncharacterized protein n=1 Tax=Mesorhabditis belari TaxID=2138241 RepID=A0AAF3F0P2_9BILA
MKGDGNKFKLTTLNPTLIVGPPLIDDDQGTSITLIRRFLNPWEMPGVPGVSLALVDVRDVARVPLIQVPYAVVYIFSFFDAQAASVLHRIGPEVKFSNKKAKRLLGLEFRDPAESIVEMTYHLIERGIIKKKSGYTGMPDKYKMAL